MRNLWDGWTDRQVAMEIVVRILCSVPCVCMEAEASCRHDVRTTAIWFFVALFVMFRTP